MARDTATPKEAPWDPTRTLVYCLDGPRGGSWYFLDTGVSSWHELRRLAIEAGETPHTGRTLGYVATREEEPHPNHPEIFGHVLAWAPDVAAEAITRKEQQR